MWPTVSYCCMSSFHRKGMNWRRSLIMKIVCIFLNWESSLRLHRLVLLHITWEGEKSTFFCSNNILLSDATMHLRGRRIKQETAADGKSPSGVSLPSVLQRRRSAHERKAYSRGKNGSISFFPRLPGCSFSCLFLVIVPTTLFIKKKEKEKEKVGEHPAISWSCSGGFEKNSRQQMRER